MQRMILGSFSTTEMDLLTGKRVRIYEVVNGSGAVGHTRFFPFLC